MKASARIGLIGGTFDPVHFGHLDAADAARQALALDEIVFVPSHVPPHRPAQPRASSFHRFALLSLAIEGRAGYRVSDVELARDGRSFTIDTLRAFHRAGAHPSQLFFIIGADAFAEIATWREFPAVLDAANFAVIARPGSALDAALAQTPDVLPRVRRDGNQHTELRSTAVFPVEARTRDISATAVRARISGGQAIDDLVPRAVAQHIASNHLYEQVDELHG